MGLFLTTPSDYIRLLATEANAIITKEKLDSFDSKILELGDVSSSSNPVNSLAAIFDLEGFTSFCKQIDPHLAVPEFLNLFLEWIFGEIRKNSIEKEEQGGYAIFSSLPFFSKFMGDGVLFLWATDGMDELEICNVIIMLNKICLRYVSDFFKAISDSISNPPVKLRCGIARGAVYSIGNGNDYVGPCINMASRLQKIGNLTFCFARRGVNFKNHMNAPEAKLFVVRKVEIRGIGADELICIRTSEYDSLPAIEKEFFREP